MKPNEKIPYSDMSQQRKNGVIKKAITSLLDDVSMKVREGMRIYLTTDFRKIELTNYFSNARHLLNICCSQDPLINAIREQTSLVFSNGIKITLSADAKFKEKEQTLSPLMDEYGSIIPCELEKVFVNPSDRTKHRIDLVMEAREKDEMARSNWRFFRAFLEKKINKIGINHLCRIERETLATALYNTITPYEKEEIPSKREQISRYIEKPTLESVHCSLKAYRVFSGFSLRLNSEKFNGLQDDQRKSLFEEFGEIEPPCEIPLFGQFKLYATWDKRRFHYDVGVVIETEPNLKKIIDSSGKLFFEDSLFDLVIGQPILETYGNIQKALGLPDEEEHNDRI